jgi:hypothetical protein
VLGTFSAMLIHGRVLCCGWVWVYRARRAAIAKSC